MSKDNVNADIYTLVSNEKRSAVRRTLWVSMILAVTVGSIQVTVGSIGIATYLNVGPLASAIIPTASLQGVVVNTTNLAALLSGVATIITFAGKHIYSGVSRAWLWRRTTRREGSTISAWRAMSSNGSLWRLRKARFFAAFVTIALIGATALMSTIFTGILLPSVKDNDFRGTFSDMPGYSGNAFHGILISCLNATGGVNCAPSFGYGSVANAILDGAVTKDFFGFGIDSVTAITGNGSSFSAGLVGDMTGILNISIPVQGSTISYRSVGLQLGATCTQLTETGKLPNGYYYNSSCLSRTVVFGDTANIGGWYSTATGCTANNTYNLEYAAAFPLNSMDNVFAFSCSIEANEGTITSVNNAGVTRFSSFVPGNLLSGDEIMPFASAFLAVVIQDQVIPGKPGSVMLDFVGAVNVDSADMNVIAAMMANGAAAAATAGYNQLIGDNSISGPYPVLHDGEYGYFVVAYGWTPHVGLLVWGILGVIYGLSWFVAAIYMTGGGTKYDPNDWLQTMNTSAGSEYVAFPGTSTGAGLSSDQVENVVVWYGALGASRIGFSGRETGAVDRTTMYM